MSLAAQPKRATVLLLWQIVAFIYGQFSLGVRSKVCVSTGLNEFFFTMTFTTV